MKNLFKNIANHFGYMPILDHQLEIQNLKDSTVTKLIKPSHSNRIRPYLHEKESWDDYWQDVFASDYIQYYLFNLSNTINSKLLRDFLFKFGTFDWSKVESHMKQTNWYWGDRKDRTPNILELQSNVIELFYSSIDNIKSTGSCESGGFTVSFDNNLVTIVFDFNLYGDDFMF